MGIFRLRNSRLRGTRMWIRSLVRGWVKWKQNGPHVFEVQQWWWRTFTLGVVLDSVTWGPLSFLRFIWGSRKVYGFDSGQGVEGVPQKQTSSPLGGFLELEELGCIDERVPSSEPLCLMVLCPPIPLTSVGPTLRGLQKHNAWAASHRSYRRAYCVVLPPSVWFPLFLSSFSLCWNSVISGAFSSFPSPCATVLLISTLQNPKLFSKLSSNLQMTWSNDIRFPCCLCTSSPVLDGVFQYWFWDSGTQYEMI